MEIQTSTFGDQTINPEDILNFPEGLIGFPNNIKFKLFNEESEAPTVFWLQSLDDPSYVLSVVTPSAYNVQYDIQLTDEQRSLIQLENSDEALILLVIYKQDESEVEAADIAIKAAIKAPIVINTRSRLGIQLSLNNLTIK